MPSSAAFFAFPSSVSEMYGRVSHSQYSSIFHSLLIGISLVFLLGVAPLFPWVILTVGWFGLLGMTMILSLVSDALSVLTGSLYICYLISTKIFSTQLAVLGSLFNLFRGSPMYRLLVTPVSAHELALRKEKKRPEKPHRFLGLRYGPVTVGNNPLHPGHFPLSDSDRLLSSLCSRKCSWRLSFFPTMIRHSSID